MNKHVANYYSFVRETNYKTKKYSMNVRESIGIGNFCKVHKEVFYEEILSFNYDLVVVLHTPSYASNPNIMVFNKIHDRK